MSALAFAPDKPPQRAAAAGPMLQRKCAACGTRGTAGESCGACKEEGRQLQRRVRSPGADGVHEAPPIVHNVLRSAGAPLDDAARASFEPRFRHDFSAVRVHTDAEAAASAHAVEADAYTVGRDIVFAAGKWSGAATDGLLAHELAHVVQQSGGSAASGPLTISDPHGAAEREAEAMARRGVEGPPDRPRERALPGLFRQETPSAPPADAQPAGMGELRVREQMELERLAEEELKGKQAEEEQQRAKETAAANLTGRFLTPTDIANAATAVPGSASPSRISPAITGAQFVLHDTGLQADTDEKIRKGLVKHANTKRRSSGEGAAAWVTKEGVATVPHDPLFGPRRPTATKWERGEDQVIDKVRMVDTKIWELCRKVWKATKAADRDKALESVLNDQGSDKAEADSEGKLAHTQLGATKGKVQSAATWTVEHICDGLTDATVPALAATPADEPILKSACGTLNTLFTVRNKRIATTVNVEIVKPKGSEYDTQKDKRKKFPKYSREVYDSVRNLYVKAALEARIYPGITTHRAIDRSIPGGHGDPRCFNVTCLYEDIAGAFGHAAGTSYGIPATAATYGRSDANDIWWDEWVCGAPIPTAGSCPKPTPPPKPAREKPKAPAKKTAGKKPK